jgi:hypothetical protein
VTEGSQLGQALPHSGSRCSNLDAAAAAGSSAEQHTGTAAAQSRSHTSGLSCKASTSVRQQQRL